MNQVDQNINKDMLDSDLIDVESLDLTDNQTWLYKIPEDSGQRVDVVDWNLSCDWPDNEDSEYLEIEKQLYAILDNILRAEVLSMPDKHKFDSRTYVKPKRRPQRPSIQSIVEVPSNPPSMSPNISFNQSTNKYLTYNKYSTPLGPISPMLRLKTFNVDANTDNSTVVKEYAMKRKSLVQDDDPQLEDADLALDGPDRISDHTSTKPINIDLSQPAHNLHNTFNKGLTNILNERGSLNMYHSGESLMRMSPPSLVSSFLMENSGTFNHESLDGRKSIPLHRDSGPPTLSGRESIDPMITSMTLSILDEKDMSTSFLSQTTYPDNESLMDSLPPSLVSSVNSSYVISNTSKPKADGNDSNIFSSATFTNLENSEKLLSARPRLQMFNNITRRESGIRNSESYTKAREEACQIDPVKVLYENTDRSSPRAIPKPNPEMQETITLHYSNNKFRRDKDAEKENFEKDDTFYKEMGVPSPEETGRNSLNLTHTVQTHTGKHELNEIIQARQKLSIARKGLPNDEKLPNQVDTAPIKTIQLPNQIITVPRQSMENASELIARRRSMNANGLDRPEEIHTRDTPKRNATFKKVSPKTSAMDTTVVYVKTEDNQMIDINSATLNLIDCSDRTLQQDEWGGGGQERAMVGSSESTDTGTLSSSSPPASVPDANVTRHQVASTPLMTLRKGVNDNLLNLHTTISPIYDMVDDKSYTLTKVPSANSSALERTYDMHNATVVNNATMVKKTSAKRDILAPKTSPEKRIPNSVQRSPPSRLSPTDIVSHGSMVPTTAVPRKTSLPTSKLRQYSSHRELSKIPGTAATRAPARVLLRRNVYASNPALSPTAPHAAHPSHPLHPPHIEREEKPQRPVVTSPPPLVRQGTETLRRERPQSQLTQPRDPPTTRPYSVAGASQLRVTRPASGPLQKPAPVPAAVVEQPRPVSGQEARMSALPRPSRLPAPRRTLRPPSVYSVAPTADVDHY